MHSFSTMLNLQISVFIILMVGVLFRKCNIITEESRSSLSSLLIDVVLPCNIVASFDTDMTTELWISLSEVILISLGIQVFVFFLSKLLYRKTPHGPKEVLQYGTITSNSGFLGNPMAYGVFGDLGLLYAAVAMLPIRVIMWSAGLSLFTNISGKSVVKKLLTHPCIIAIFVGFAVMLMPWELPTFCSKTLHYIGDCTIFISMLVIGSILADIQLADLNLKRIGFYCFVRLLLIPFAVLGVLSLLGIDSLITGVAVLLSAMPAASTTAILAEKYGGDAKFASAIVFFSTLLSMITVPVVLLFV